MTVDRKNENIELEAMDENTDDDVDEADHDAVYVVADEIERLGIDTPEEAHALVARLIEHQRIRRGLVFPQAVAIDGIRSGYWLDAYGFPKVGDTVHIPHDVDVDGNEITCPCKVRTHGLFLFDIEDIEDVEE